MLAFLFGCLQLKLEMLLPLPKAQPCRGHSRKVLIGSERVEEAPHHVYIASSEQQEASVAFC